MFAWAQPSNATIAQLRNASWAGVFDGIQAGGCGPHFTADGGFEVNETQWSGCAALRRAVADAGMAFHVWTNAIPEAAVANPAPTVAAIAKAARKYGFAGISVDDESDCAPRSTLHNLTRWCGFWDALASGLAAEATARGSNAAEPLQLSAAVQALFGIQDVP